VYFWLRLSVCEYEPEQANKKRRQADNEVEAMALGQ
jgi:hypothetical protein